MDPAFVTAQKAVQAIGQAALADVLCSGLLAAKFQDGFHLFDIGTQGLCEILSHERVPFVCHGSGKQNADPILRFLWNIYWAQHSPSLREAILVGYWTVKIGIQLKSPGVGFDPEVFVLEKVGRDGKHARARQIQNEELAQHDEFIVAVEDAMRDVRKKILTGGEPSPPAPPTAGN